MSDNLQSDLAEHCIKLEARLESQQAAHDAEIAKLKSELIASDAALRESRANDMESMRQLSESLSACARKDDALKEALGFTGSREIDAKIQKAISATSQQVSEWERKQLEPLRAHIDEANSLANMQDIAIEKLRAQAAMLANMFQSVWSVIPKEVYFSQDTIDSANAKLYNTQAIAEQFISECEQRGAVKALEDARDKFNGNVGFNFMYQEHVASGAYSDASGELDVMVEELSATSKKAG